MSNLLENPNFVSYLWIPLTLHCAIGVVAAIVAQRKGFDLRRWLIWGIIGGTPTLIVAVLAKKSSS